MLGRPNGRPFYTWERCIESGDVDSKGAIVPFHARIGAKFRTCIDYASLEHLSGRACNFPSRWPTCLKFNRCE